MESMEGEETKELAELMAITNLDFAHCVELYVASEKNFQKAVANYFADSPTKIIPASQINVSTEHSTKASSNQQWQLRQSGQPSQSIAAKIFQRRTKPAEESSSQPIDFRKTYLIKKRLRNTRGRTIREKQDLSSIVIDQSFLDKLRELCNCTLSFESEMLVALEEIWNQKAILALHCLDLSCANETIKRLYNFKSFVGIFGIEFKNYGIDCSTYELEEQLKKFVDLVADVNSVIFLCVRELTNNIQVICKTPISELDALKTFQQVAQFAEKVKSNANRLKMKDIRKPIDVDIEKPINNSWQKNKIEEDRRIRMQQQMEYFQTLVQLQPTMTTPTTSYKDLRKTLRQSLKIPEGDIKDPIMIKIRLPNGLTRELNLPQEYRVGYLYDYVLSDPAEDIGFENDLDRNFEFVRPYETLDLDKSKTLGDAFPGSKMEYLIVKEL